MPRRATNLKKKLIYQGILIIKDNGLSDLSLREVTSKCGVSHSSVYRYFPHKDDYINAVLYEISNCFGNYLIKDTESIENPKIRLEFMGMNFVNFAQNEPNLFNTLFLNNQSKTINFNEEKDFKFLAYQKFVMTIQEIAGRKNINNMVIHLWSYIMGLAVLTANNDLKISNLLIKDNIHQMVEIYFSNRREEE